jgi:acyl-coenzyme A thioesterase PaaI-like protein
MKDVLAFVAALTMAIGTAWPPATSARDEQKLTLDQVPATVKATFDREAKGGAIGEVTREIEKGKAKAFYEAHITRNGKDMYVHVREDGTVVKRESARKQSTR